MATESDKKIVIFYVLDVLREYSDSEHLLTYRQIVDKINARYGITPDVKAIAKNINTLTEVGYEITKCGYKGCYLSERGFENGELMYLIDAINSSSAIVPNQAKDLVEKLTKDCSMYEKKKFTSVLKLDGNTKTKNKELFYVIEILAEAIEKNKKVSFCYNEFKPSKELKPRETGKEYVINPYYMVNSHGKYYLVCNYDKYDDISNYKIELISNIKILDDKRKDIKKIVGGKQFSINQYIKEHIYMTFGDSVVAQLKLTNPKRINDVIDWFGENFEIVSENKDEMIIRINVNEQALIFWALQYGNCVEILSPNTTREKMRKELLTQLEKYNN